MTIAHIQVTTVAKATAKVFHDPPPPHYHLLLLLTYLLLSQQCDCRLGFSVNSEKQFANCLLTGDSFTQYQLFFGVELANFGLDLKLKTTQHPLLKKLKLNLNLNLNSKSGNKDSPAEWRIHRTRLCSKLLSTPQCSDSLHAV